MKNRENGTSQFFLNSKIGRGEPITLCKPCFEREGLVVRNRQPRARSVKKPVVSKEPDKCAICEGRLGKLDEIAQKIVLQLRGYDFDTFLVGTTINQELVEKEDEFRSRLGIRGRESLKTQITRTIGAKVAALTGKKVDYNKPDITVLVSMHGSDNESIDINPRTIWVFGRYTKSERGIQQKSRICQVCSGLGCASCGFAGTSGQSVQSIAGKFFRSAFDAEECNFIWLGGEDENSLVLGNGRPFFAEIVKPRKRSLLLRQEGETRLRGKTSKALGASTRVPSTLLSGVKAPNQSGVCFTIIRQLESKPTSIPQFRILCEVNLIQSKSDNVGRINGTEIESRFNNCDIYVQSSRRFKRMRKRIDWIKVSESEDHSSATLKISCDGGIPIKKLVGGEAATGGGGSVSPDLSGLIDGFEIDDSRPFDVLDVNLVGASESMENFTSTAT